MVHLINFEIKKILNKKRNIVTVGLFFIIVILFILLYSSNEKMFDNSMVLNMDKNIESVEEALVRIEDEILKLPDNKNLQEIAMDYKEEIDILKEMKIYYNNNEWNKYLEVRIKSNEILLENIRSNKVITGREIDDIKMEIEVDKLLLDKGIKPIYTDVSMEGFNFIKIFLNGALILMIMVLVIFISSDVMSSEFQSNTYKLLFTQPISKRKILLSKIIAAVVVTNVIVFFIIGTLFFILGITKGFGAINYPIIFYHAGNIEYIEVGKYIMVGLTLLSVLITLTSVLSIFISSLNKRTNTSMILTVIILISLYFISDIGLIKNIAHMNPFTYLQIGEVLQGNLANILDNTNITIQNGLLSSSILFFVLLITNIYLFDKSNIAL
ncbi:ABC transporter permease subunit [Clostridium tarantellae]|uniref:ABC transporter permease subunit n=1 Tax=Clostridium tarantellae TaxID=39493 RepID=A0A6I1MPV4_9CLOT|nr:ABC transporter permease subunit [Clostridium tarantellae]MPQ44843.1 ABC transporter permease subunit [Clostridium tarantellae]